MLSILNVRSQEHLSCEDSYFAVENPDFIYGGVFDGCSTGKNSHWASQTLAYAYEDACRLHSFKNILSDTVTLSVLRRLESIAVADLGIDHMHFLATAVLFLFDKERSVLYTRTFGDGVIIVNGHQYVEDQDNQPDYLAYYMNQVPTRRLDMLKKVPKKEWQGVYSFQICSDGIHAIKENQFQSSDKDPITLLKASPTSANYLQRMWNILHRDKFQAGDDLTIISYATTT